MTRLIVISELTLFFYINMIENNNSLQYDILEYLLHTD